MNDEITGRYNKILLWLMLSTGFINLATLFVPIFHLNFYGLATMTELGIKFLLPDIDAIRANMGTGTLGFETYMGCSTEFLNNEIGWQITIKCVLIIMLISGLAGFAYLGKPVNTFNSTMKQSLYISHVDCCFVISTVYMLITVFLCIVLINEGDTKPVVTVVTYTYIPWILQLGIFIAAKVLKNHNKRALNGEVEPIAVSSSINSLNTIGSDRSKEAETDKADLLMKYKQLLDDGVITKEEYDIKKSELLK